jgi:hypothetical protein
MTPKTYSRLAALIFAIVALLQLARAVSGWPITVDTNISVPIWASCSALSQLDWPGSVSLHPGPEDRRFDPSEERPWPIFSSSVQVAASD